VDQSAQTNPSTVHLSVFIGLRLCKVTKDTALNQHDAFAE